MPEVPPAPKVYKDSAASQRVAKKTGQQSRSHQRVVLAFVENIDQQGNREAAAGQRRADHDIDHHPNAPGVAVVNIGNRPQAKYEAHQKNGGHDGNEHAADHGCRIDQTAADRRGRCLLMSRHDHFSPLSLPVPDSSSSSCTLRLAMKLNAPSTTTGITSPP